MGANGTGSGVEKWVIFGLGKWEWNTFTTERKEWSKLGILMMNNSPENKQLLGY